ncbi:MAG: SPOR domain-containing protein [Spirochaetes bacterium]|nr:SPOR domain-containing protein [Spirochaetota bacterium]
MRKNKILINNQFAKYCVLLFLLLFILLHILFSQTNEVNGLSKLYDSSYIGKKFSSGYLYNPEELVASSKYYDLYSLLTVENINNGKKTIVIVIDNNLPLSNEKDILLYLSKRAFVELGEISGSLIPVKVSLIKKISKNEIENLIKKPSIAEETKNSTTSNINETSKNLNQNNVEQKEKIYFIQVGVFYVEENYKNVKKNLESYGFNVHVRESIINNKKVFKVAVGPYDYDKAKEILKILQNMGFKDAFIVKNF